MKNIWCLLILPLLVISSAGCVTPPRKQIKELSLQVSDKEAPKEKPGHLQAEYEGVYLIDVASGSERRIDTLGYKSSPIFDPCGQHIAYLHGVPTTIPTEIRICNLASGTIEKVPAPGARRLGLSYLPDGKSIAYTTTNAIVILNLSDLTQRSFPVANANNIAVSPDGRLIVFWKREENDSNDADGWILYCLNVSTSRIISTGKKNDGRGVAGQAYWHPSGNKFMIMTFNVDKENIRSNITNSWFSSSLEELSEVEPWPSVIMQNRYPWAGR